MAKVAILSDIHGNLPALEAVIKDIRRRKIKRIVCLGDLVGKGPQPAEVVDRIREICELTVQGNWDLGIQEPQVKDAGLWQQERLGEERLRYLKDLPFSADLHLSGRWLRLLHASSKSVYHRIPRKASKKERLSLFQHTELTGFPEGEFEGRTPDVVGYGDIHVPFVQTVKTKEGHGLLLFNTGSVGAPYDGIPQASYTIVEGKPDGGADEPFSIQMVRVPYNVEQVIAIAEQVQLPNLERFRYEMRTGLEQ
ncbi:metallophosphoesterase family protein [Paenibacillus rigui]|uniref:Metallophosphatase family protein n=1 Tax=Paenibacillus rigui TaxID=554312 RepID=A0A229ULA6_9BACL|nr:metallophosphoesterase family protein [Paenibacillus rigui]OXM84162.1 metallophosphatase family protein [Paenibacillus rigui]